MLFPLSRLSLLSLLTFVLLHQVASLPFSRQLFKRHVSGAQMNGSNFPDPSILKVGSTWYAFATNAAAQKINIQVATSPDFNTWTLHNGFDALPNVPSWVDQSSPNTWAPDVNQLVSRIGSLCLSCAHRTFTGRRLFCHVLYCFDCERQCTPLHRRCYRHFCNGSIHPNGRRAMGVLGGNGRSN